MPLKKPVSFGVLVGLLALAFGALPAFASATTLKTAAGPLGVGDPVSALSTNLVTETAAGTLSCEETELGGEVVSNGGTLAEVGVFEGRAEGGGTNPGECALLGNPEAKGVTVTVNSVGPIKFDAATATDESAAEFTAVIHLKSGASATCIFQGNLTTSFALNSPLGDHVGPSPLAAKAGTGCPVTGGVIEGDFAVTSGGEAVEVG